jgi:hypothetical protein
MLHLTLLWPKSTSGAVVVFLIRILFLNITGESRLSQERKSKHIFQMRQGIDEVDVQDSIGQNGVYVSLH